MIIFLRRLSDNKLFSFPVCIKLALLFPLVAGCAIVATKPVGVRTIVTEPVAIAENVTLASFSLTGRISVQNEKQRFSGGVRWYHTGMTDEIFLLSPLGQVMVQIMQDGEGAHLTTSEQQVFSAPDIEILTEEVLGWRIPISGLRYWVRGEHFPATVAIKQLDSEGRAVAIHQDGWDIIYVNYFSAQSAHTARPRVLAINFEALKMKLVVDRWDVE